MSASRTPQSCAVCFAIDTDPRHQTYDIPTDTTRIAHFDCCAASGCGVCTSVLAAAPTDARRGDALTAYLTKDN